MEEVQQDPIRMLVGLITSTATTNKVRDELQRALDSLCNIEPNLWHALRGKEGVQLLFSLLGVGGPRQEYALGLLRLLANENDESKQAITEALIDLIHNPIREDRPAALLLALGLVTPLAKDCPCYQGNLVYSGALEGLSNYLSLGPPDDATEAAATYLLGLLSSNLCSNQFYSQFYKSHSEVASQIIAVLQKGARGARCSAAKALELMFWKTSIGYDDVSIQAVPLLVEILNTGLEGEELHSAIGALVALHRESDLPQLPPAIEAAVETISVDVLCRLLSSNCSMELKRDTAALCSAIFWKLSVVSTPAAASCVKPLVSLLDKEFEPCHLPVVKALHKLVSLRKLAEEVVALGVIASLVHLLTGKDYMLQVAICRLLKKLEKKMWPACRDEMLNAGVIEKIDEIYLEAPHYTKAFAKLLRALTYNKRKGDFPRVSEPQTVRIRWV